MKWRALILLSAAFLMTAAFGQNDNTIHVKAFPGNDVGTLVKNAMATCGTNTAVPCILVIDPSLATWNPGTMPTLCSHCYLEDLRNGPPVTGLLPANNLSDLTSQQAALAHLEGLPALYITNYGAKCDGTTLTDVTTTSGSPVISSASYSFTTADVGKHITVYAGSTVSTTANVSTNIASNLGSGSGILIGQQVVGATTAPGTLVWDGVTNPTGSSLTIHLSKYIKVAPTSDTLTFVNPIHTTIVSVAGGSATLATNAVSSSSGTALVIFGTDDTAAIQSAEAAANDAGGGLVMLPLGMCIVSGTINTDSNVSFKGLGAGKSILYWISSSDMTSGLFKTTLSSYPNDNFLRNNQWRDFTIDLTQATDATPTANAKAIQFENSNESVVDHIEIINSPATAIATDDSLGSIITNNFLYNCGRLNGAAAGGNCIGEGLSSSYWLEGYIIANNYIVNPAHYGIYVEAEAAHDYLGPINIVANLITEGSLATTFNGTTPTAAIGNGGGIGMTVTGNTIIGNGNGQPWCGISQDSGGTAMAGGVQTAITGNYVTAAGCGILLNYTAAIPTGGRFANLIVNGNQLYGSVGGSSVYGGCGICVAANSSTAIIGVNLTGNIISGNGGAGIDFEGAAKRVTITSNQITDNAATTTTTYQKSAIAVNGNLNDAIVEGNHILNTANTQIYGFYLNTGFTATNLLMTANDFSGTVHPADLLGTVVTSVIKNNIGIDQGTLFTVSGCSAHGPAGGALSGFFYSGTTGTCTATITLNGATGLSGTVPNGWFCSASDLSNPSNQILQTGTSTATVILSGTTTTNDEIQFTCSSY